MDHTLLPYPQFQARQVLTDKQLNALRDFQDQQNRLTRSFGIGAGIVCGLHVDHQYDATCSEHSVTLTPGYGFTSDGFLVLMDAPASGEPYTYTHVRPYRFSALDSQLPETYLSWRGKPIWELLTAQEAMAADPVDGQPELLSEKHFVGTVPTQEGESTQGHTLAIFLEKYPVADDPCVRTECKSNGSMATLRPRPVLLRLEPLPVCEPLKPVYVPRFHTALSPAGPTPPVRTPLNWISSSLEINTAYGNIVEDLRQRPDGLGLVENIRAAYERYKKFLYLGAEVDVDALEKHLAAQIPFERFEHHYHQYYYDYIKDLATAYNEFLVAACHLTGSCWPVDGFERHLMLRKFVRATDRYTYSDEAGYRHGFYPAPVENARSGDWARVRNLFLRIQDMIYAFDPAVVDEVQNPVLIVPSQTEAYPLGKRAVPYYFPLVNEASKKAFGDHWQPADCCTGEPVLSYYRGIEGVTVVPIEAKKVSARSTMPLSTTVGLRALPAYPTFPLYYGQGGTHFYRIEGHVGKNPQSAIQQILSQRIAHNLEFDVLLVDLSMESQNQSLEIQPQQVDVPVFTGGSYSSTLYVANKYFFTQLPDEMLGIEHTAGVKPGGTFIVVCDQVCVESCQDEKNRRTELLVVADFSLTDRALIHLRALLSGRGQFEGTVKPVVLTGVAVAEAPVTPVPAAEAVFLARNATYSDRIFNLNANGTFQGALFNSAIDFLKSGGSPEEKANAFLSLTARILTTLARTLDPGKRQGYQVILENLTFFLLDKLVQSGLPTNLAQIQGRINEFQNLGLAKSRIRTNWNSGEIAPLTSKEQLSTVNKLLD